jgi:yecA family protein
MSNFQQNVFNDFIVFNKIHPQAKKLRSVYYQIGFICSVQAVPELVDLEQWLPLLWEEGADISFDNEQQASEYAQTIFNIANEIELLYQQSIPLQDLECEKWLDCENNINTKGIQFAQGYLAAIELFNAQWSVIDDNDQTQHLLQTVILLLSKLAPAKHIDENLTAIFEQLPTPVEIVGILPLLLTNLAVSAAQYVENPSQ